MPQEEMVCIVCPNGCRLTLTQTQGGWDVQGAQCKKGIAFANEEKTNPVRALSSTVDTVFADMPRLPVKTRGEIPKGQMFAVMQKIRGAKVTTRLQMGDVVLADVCGTDIIATATMEDPA